MAILLLRAGLEAQPPVQRALAGAQVFVIPPFAFNPGLISVSLKREISLSLNSHPHL